MEEISHEEFMRRVAIAALAVIEEDKQSPQEEDEGTSGVVTIAKRAGLPVGHVRQALKDFGFQGTFGDHLVMTPHVVERLESAAAPLRIRYGDEGSPRNVVNIHGGTGVQASAGGDVIGDLTVTVTYQEVLAELEKDIDKSALAPEKKTEARGLLRKFAATVGETVLKAGMEILVKQTLGGG